MPVPSEQEVMAAMDVLKRWMGSPVRLHVTIVEKGSGQFDVQVEKQWPGDSQLTTRCATMDVGQTLQIDVGRSLDLTCMGG